jgi:aldehyde:ferredoxin oxidoreductase
MSGNSASGGRLIRVDMTNQTVSIAPYPAAWALLGGRALSARILLEECDASCDPLGPDNVFVVAPGVLAGTAAPTSGRISVGAKSPLTNGIKEANAGGDPGQDLMKLGYRAIIVKGQPADGERRYGLEITAEGARIVEADAYKGRWNYALCAELAQHYPKTVSFITIGPAGELRLKGASVACTDHDNRYPARHAARGGLGAVMGSKGLKYIAIDAGKARTRQPAEAAAFTELCRKYTRDYLDGPQIFAKGTSAVVPLANKLNTFPTRNRTSGQFEHAKTLDGARIIESFEERGGRMHNCMAGCIVKCSNIVHDREGNYKTSALEFETLTLLGANCGIASWEDVADLDRLCDEIGLDTIETGAAIAIYMDAGQMHYGDAEGAKRILQEIAAGTELGKAIGNGALAIAKKTGHKRVPVVKGQAIPAWEPRTLKATGVTYATSAMGADHTAGLIINPGLPEDQWASASQIAQLVNAVCDSSGFCQFLQPSLDDLRLFYSYLYGEEISREQIADYGWQILQDEWEFNRRAGFKDEDDRLPEYMKEEGIGPQNAVFDVSLDIIHQAKQRLSLGDRLFTTKATG